VNLRLLNPLVTIGSTIRVQVPCNSALGTVTMDPAGESKRPGVRNVVMRKGFHVFSNDHENYSTPWVFTDRVNEAILFPFFGTLGEVHDNR